MIKRNGKKIAAIAIAGTLMMQNMNTHICNGKFSRKCRKRKY